MKRLFRMIALTAPLSLLSPSAAMACSGVAEPDQVAQHMADLPMEIQASLTDMTQGRVAEYGTPLLQTDAPGEDDRDKAEVRLSRGFLNGDRWIVFVEIAMMRDPRSIGYVRGQDGTFALSAGYFLIGEECAVRRAIQDGVRGAD